jgi:hypothetical protein
MVGEKKNLQRQAKEVRNQKRRRRMGMERDNHLIF